MRLLEQGRRLKEGGTYFKVRGYIYMKFQKCVIYLSKQQSINTIIRYGLILREKCPNAEFFLVRIFLYSNIQPNTGKYGPEKTPSLGTFHAVLNIPELVVNFIFFIVNILLPLVF